MTKALRANRFTPLQQQTMPNDAFSHPNTPLNSALDVCPLFCVDALMYGEPSSTRFMSVLAVCLEQGEMNQAVTSISTSIQIHQIIFSANAKHKTALKMAQTGLGLAKNLPLPSRQDKDFSHTNVLGSWEYDWIGVLIKPRTISELIAGY